MNTSISASWLPSAPHKRPEFGVGNLKQRFACAKSVATRALVATGPCNPLGIALAVWIASCSSSLIAGIASSIAALCVGAWFTYCEYSKVGRASLPIKAAIAIAAALALVHEWPVALSAGLSFIAASAACFELGRSEKWTAQVDLSPRWV